MRNTMVVYVVGLCGAFLLGVVVPMCVPAVAGAESARVEENDGLVILGDCVRQFDASPSNHRMLGVTGEELDTCLLEARIALDAELAFIAAMRPQIPPIEEGVEGVGRMVATTSSIALEGAMAAEAVAAIDHALKREPLWLEPDPIVRLRMAVGSLEAAREVLTLTSPM